MSFISPQSDQCFLQMTSVPSCSVPLRLFCVDYDDDDDDDGRQDGTEAFENVIAILWRHNMQLLSALDWYMIRLVSAGCHKLIDIKHVFATYKPWRANIECPDDPWLCDLVFLAMCCEDYKMETWLTKTCGMPQLTHLAYVTHKHFKKTKVRTEPHNRIPAACWCELEALLDLLEWCYHPELILKVLRPLHLGFDVHELLKALPACSSDIHCLDYFMMHVVEESPFARGNLFKQYPFKQAIKCVTLMSNPRALRHLCERWHLNLQTVPEFKYRAAAGAYVETLQLYHEYVPKPFNMDMLQAVFTDHNRFAKDQRYVDTLNYVLDNLEERLKQQIPTNKHLMVYAAHTGRIGLVNALEERGLQCSTCALVEAVEVWHWDMMEFLWRRLCANRVAVPEHIWFYIFTKIKHIYETPQLRNDRTSDETTPDLQRVCDMALTNLELCPEDRLKFISHTRDLACVEK